jgi:hypothetical protein
MKKKIAFILGTLAALLALSVVLTGCEDPNGGGGVPSGTIKLASTGINQFTLTLSAGLTWKPKAEIEATDNRGLAFILGAYLELDGVATVGDLGPEDSDNKLINQGSKFTFTVERTSDTVVTVALSQGNYDNSTYFFGTGKLQLADMTKNWNGGDDLSFSEPERGASLLEMYTAEGLAYSGDIPSGNLKAANDSGQVTFSIAKKD